MKIKDIMAAMEKIAPQVLAKATDRTNGLQIGDAEARVSKVLVTLDITTQAIQKAVAARAQLIIAHHPLFPIMPDNIDTGTPLGRKLKIILSKDIAVFVAHTNLDAAPQGVNHWLAKREGLDPEVCEVIEPTYIEELCKLAVFVPKVHADKVRDAMALAGAGHIGNYSHCSFNTEGLGTFKPLAGTNPYIGKKGKLEKAAETRIEVILPKRLLSAVKQAMLKAHPYEEVAYDVYLLENKGRVYGLGLVGDLSKSKLIGGKKVKRLAVNSGSGGKLIPQAKAMGAQAMILGECSYHDELLAKELGLALIKKGHFNTENLIIRPLTRMLKNHLPSLKILIN